ncbi:MAG: radical SAM protein [Candidatus Thorarchaeota archaeon]
MIIPAYNRSDLLEINLVSLFNQNYPKDKYEIVVVDDGSTDDIFSMIKRLKSTCDIRYIYWPRNKPYKFGEPGNRAGPARNLGVKHSKYNTLLFWDSDMIADSNMLDEHMKAFNKNISVLGIRKNLKENFMEKERIINSLKEGTFNVSDADLGEDMRIGKLLKDNNYDIMGYEQPWFFWISNNILIDKDLFLKTGGFDNNFVFWGDEDQELGYRLFEKGIQFKFNKKAIGYHQHHKDESVSDDIFFKTKKIHKNIFYKKHLDKDIFEFYSHFFKYRKLKNKYEFVNINLTNLCNLNCSMCFDSIEDRKEKKELSLRELKELFDSLGALGITRINFSGGEPTLRKDFFQILDYANKLGFTISLNTNGCFGENFLRELANFKIDKIVFSLNSSNPETHDRITGKKGSFKKCVENIMKLKELDSHNNIKIFAQCVIMGINLHEIVDFVKYAHKLGIDGVLFQAFNPFKGILKENNIVKTVKSHLNMEELWVSPKQYKLLDFTINELINFKKNKGFIVNSISYLSLMKNYFRTPSLSKLGIKCICSSHLGIDSDGKVMPCWGIEWNLGNIKNKPLKDILQSREFNDAGKTIINCDIPCMLMCYKKVL